MVKVCFFNNDDRFIILLLWILPFLLKIVIPTLAFENLWMFFFFFVVIVSSIIFPIYVFRKTNAYVMPEQIYFDSAKDLILFLLKRFLPTLKNFDGFFDLPFTEIS